MAKKKSLCADTSEMTDTEKKIMARAMTAGEDQINIIRDDQAKSQDADSEEEE